MPSGYSRRTVIAGAVGGLGVLGTGTLAYRSYDRRHHVRLQPLALRNESDDEVSVTVAVSGNRHSREETLVVSPGDRERFEYRWRKVADEYTIEARYDDHSLTLDAATITERLEDSGWGSDDACVTIVVTADGSLDSRVSPPDDC